MINMVDLRRIKKDGSSIIRWTPTGDEPQISTITRLPCGGGRPFKNKQKRTLDNHQTELEAED